MLNTAHWNWKGYSPTLAGYEHRIDISLTLMVNNSCIAIGPNLQECASCHVGYGWVDKSFDFSNPANIDCLVCHDTTGTYRKEPGQGGFPDPSLDLAAIAKKVGRPSRQACGSCHFVSGGASYTKHGDLEPALADPPTGLDMHMGALQMRCQDCHSTVEHRIMGMSMSAPAVEGRVDCEKCHGTTPHGVAGMLGRHLDDHIRAVACETCHIPSIARSAPTLVRRDYSRAGEDQPEGRDRYGMPQYDKKFGVLTWGEDIVPTYLWSDGTRKASLTGDKIDPSATVVLNSPVGEKRNPAARIFPFQEHAAVQPYDTENAVMAMPKLLGGYLDGLQLVEGHRRRNEAGRAALLGEIRFRRNQDVFLDSSRGGLCEEGPWVLRLPRHRSGYVHALPSERRGNGPARAPPGGLSGGQPSDRLQGPWLSGRPCAGGRTLLHQLRPGLAAEVAELRGGRLGINWTEAQSKIVCASCGRGASACHEE